MANLQLEYTYDELLATHAVDEPLIAGGVRGHGGFLDDGTYVPPRTRFRAPALTADRAEIERALGAHPRGRDLVAEFHALGD